MSRLLYIAALMFVATPAFAEKPPVDAPEKTADARDKIICKKFLDTGSLVRGTRTCKTKAEWERDRENVRTMNTGIGSCGNSGQGAGCS